MFSQTYTSDSFASMQILCNPNGKVMEDISSFAEHLYWSTFFKKFSVDLC